MRRSPTQSAAASKLGARMIGNDGFEWVVVRARNGVQRWARAGKLPGKGAAMRRSAARGKNATGKGATLKAGKGVATRKASKGVATRKASKGAATRKASKGAATRKANKGGGRKTAALAAVAAGKMPLHHRPRNDAERAAWIRQHPRMLNLIAAGDPKAVRHLSREEAIRRLREMRDVWEVVTTRCQNLSDARLESETTTSVKRMLAWYCSEEARGCIAWALIDVIKLLARD